MRGTRNRSLLVLTFAFVLVFHDYGGKTVERFSKRYETWAECEQARIAAVARRQELADYAVFLNGRWVHPMDPSAISYSASCVPY